MDKDILEEPMKDAKNNYEKYIDENIDKLNEDEKLKYTS